MQVALNSKAISIIVVVSVLVAVNKLGSTSKLIKFLNYNPLIS